MLSGRFVRGFATAVHVPVMPVESLHRLQVEKGGIYYDFSLGEAGHTALILQREGCSVVGVDRDAQAIASAREILREHLGDHYDDDRFKPVKASWSELRGTVANERRATADGVLMDLGLCTLQLEDDDRGFSFKHPEAPLNMRADNDNNSNAPTAAEFLNTADEDQLVQQFLLVGETRRRAKWIARRVCRMRPLATVGDFTSICRNPQSGIVPGRRTDPATLPFLALRIHVNNEVQQLIDGLIAAETLLKPGGRLVVITYQSLEDRIVKKFMHLCSKPNKAQSADDERELQASFEWKAKAHVPVTSEEVAENSRSRSATLRHATRTAGSPLSESVDLSLVLNQLARKHKVRKD